MQAVFRQHYGINPLTLRFSGDHAGRESAFLADYFQKSINQLRFSVVLGIVLYGFFGVLDYLLIPDVKEQIWFIRYALVCPYLALYLLATWLPGFNKYMQPSIVLTVLLVGFSVLAMTVIAYPPGSYYYYAGLILVLMWCYTFTATRFLYATLAGWLLVVAYQIAALWLIDTPLPVLFSNNFFFISANIIGMMACYLIEFYKRRDFWQRSLIEEERSKSEALLHKLQGELTLASQIQKSLLPPPLFNLANVEVACYSRPTLEIGGDFYSYHSFQDGRFSLAIGDVSGKGIPAALLMAASLSLFDSTFMQDPKPAERLMRLDKELAPYTEARYQNCAFCYLELDGNTLHIVNAGGIPPYIRHLEGDVEWPRAVGFPLGSGMGAQVGYTSLPCSLSAGDLVILVSDGIIEAKDKSHGMFGFRRLRSCIGSGPLESVTGMIEHIVQQVTDFMGDMELQDDLTIAVLRYNGS